jgi:hypothetical protein
MAVLDPASSLRDSCRAPALNLEATMTTFTITSAYVGTKTNGTVQAPPIGEWWPLTVEFTVSGTPKNTYHIDFTIAEQSTYVEFTDKTAGPKTATGWLFVPLDGSMSWAVEIDPFNLVDADDPTKSQIPINLPNGIGASSTQRVTISKPVIQVAGKKKLQGTFEPNPPTKAIDFYDPVWAVGAQSVFTKFKAGGTITHIEALAGCPSTESWQKVLSTVFRVDSGAGTEFLKSQPVNQITMEPVFFLNKKNIPVAEVSLIQQFVLELKNLRVDASLLRAVTWAQLDALSGINVFKFYQSPEAVIESNHAKIADFVKQTLGANHRQHYTPYDAARKLFQAVLAHTKYYYPAPNTEDLRPDTALGMLDKGFGDCGGFSILLVALYRNIGFPARTACGAWIGQDAGHCWCEMYFPGHGWMISDGSAGNSLSESGKHAYYFGAVPNLNSRYACMRSNTFAIGDISTSWLQAPYGPTIKGTATTASVDVHTALVQVTESEAKSLASAHQSHAMHGAKPSEAAAHGLQVLPLPQGIQTQTSLAKIDAVTACRCHAHGGFRLRHLVHQPV